MKRLLYCLAVAAFFGACLPEEDQTNPLIVPTCYDGIKNQDEVSIDCGGRCEACELTGPVVAPCGQSLKTNVVLRGTQEITLKASELIARQEEDQYYFFSAFVGTNQTLTVQLGGEYKPYRSAVYEISSDGFFWPGKAVVSYTDGYYSYTAQTGDVYVTVNQGKITAEICAVQLREENNFRPAVTISGRLVGQ
jgi:hypothetical protein